MSGPSANSAAFARRFLTQLRDDVRLLPVMVRKPRVLLNWLVSARRAQLALVVLAVSMPLLVVPLFDWLLASLYGTVEVESFFGLVKSEIEDPELYDAQQAMRLVMWFVSVLVVLYFLLRHASRNLQLVNIKRLTLESKADGLVNSKPSDSILLYNAARQWCVESADESKLQTKLDTLNTTISEATAAAAQIDEVDVNSDFLPGTDPNATMVVKKTDKALVGERYHIKNKLGRGAMGIVYLARDTRLDRDVALKQLSPHLSDDKQQFARFRQEALALAKMSHPNIVQVYDFIEWKGYSWIAMEYVEGKELKDILDSSAAIPTSRAITLTKKMAAALDYAHDKGIVHRDFKPANVLVMQNGDIKIMDFGIAKLTQSGLHTQDGTMMGSPAYMSPEQAAGKQTDTRTDIYALGVVLYQMLAGKLPFEGDAIQMMAQHMKQAPNSLVGLGVPYEVDAVVQKMLAKDPQARYQHMNELIAEL